MWAMCPRRWPYGERGQVMKAKGKDPFIEGGVGGSTGTRRILEARS